MLKKFIPLDFSFVDFLFLDNWRFRRQRAEAEVFEPHKHSDVSAEPHRPDLEAEMMEHRRHTDDLPYNEE